MTVSGILDLQVRLESNRFIWSRAIYSRGTFVLVRRIKTRDLKLLGFRNQFSMRYEEGRISFPRQPQHKLDEITREKLAKTDYFKEPFLMFSFSSIIATAFYLSALRK